VSPAVHHLRAHTLALFKSPVALVWLGLLSFAMAHLVSVYDYGLPPFLQFVLPALGLGLTTSLGMWTSGLRGLGNKTPHTGLPMSLRVRFGMEGLSWILAWAAVAAAIGFASWLWPLAHTNGSGRVVSLVPGWPAQCRAVMLAAPILLLCSFARAGRTSIGWVLWLSLGAAALESGCLLSGRFEGVAGAAWIAAVATALVLMAGPAVANLGELTLPWGSAGAPHREPRSPQRTLARDAVVGCVASTLFVIPLITLGFAGIILFFHWTDNPIVQGWASPTPWWGVYLVGMSLLAPIFAPFQGSTRTVGPGGCADMNGDYARAWGVLPLRRRAVVAALYWPSLVCGLAGACVLAFAMLNGPRMGQGPPEPDFLLAMFSTTFATVGLFTGGALGDRFVRRTAAGLALFSLGVLFLWSIWRGAGGVVAAFLVLVGVTLPALTYRRAVG
jgi:hypothetical protein